MIELLSDNWPVVLAAVMIGLIIAFLLFRPRQRVTLTDSAPVRPHMARDAFGRGIADEAATAAGDVAGEMLEVKAHFELPGGSGAPDDLKLLKGVGPKMAKMLNDRGISRFAQIAGMSPGQIEVLDAEMGAFRGRFGRDRIVEQADYLARGDHDGYEQKFGKISG